jgi:ADP-ribose pyrophosphatase
MEVNNPKYKNQGIHVISAIFTVDKGITKVLLIERKNEPFKGLWALVGGSLYNDETVIEGMRREISEKTGIPSIHLETFNIFSRVDRSPVMRMIAVGYLGIVDSKAIDFIKETSKTSNCDWFPIDAIDELAYDHNEILFDAINVLKSRIQKTDMLRNLYPEGFTIPEIQKTYEAILSKEYDRRNFRKKLLALGIIYDTGNEKKFQGNKPAKVYQFKDKEDDKSVF